MQIDPKKTAILFIEFQNEFCHPKGVLNSAVQGSIESTGMMKNSVRVAEAMREAGATVMHAPIFFSEGHSELPKDIYGILKGVADGNAFVKGSWGAEFFEEMKPQDGDIIVDGKIGLDAFKCTNLDYLLRANGIETLVVAGFLTNCCVESTLRTGYELNYQTVSLTDCTAATSDEEQTFASTKSHPMFSHTMSHDALIAALSGTAAPASGSTTRAYETAS